MDDRDTTTTIDLQRSSSTAGRNSHYTDCQYLGKTGEKRRTRETVGNSNDALRKDTHMDLVGADDDPLGTAESDPADLI